MVYHNGSTSYTLMGIQEVHTEVMHESHYDNNTYCCTWKGYYDTCTCTGTDATALQGI